MRMKKWFKSTVAMIAMIAMLAENGYSVYATELGGDYSADESAVEETQVVEDDGLYDEIVDESDFDADEAEEVTADDEQDDEDAEIVDDSDDDTAETDDAAVEEKQDDVSDDASDVVEDNGSEKKDKAEKKDKSLEIKDNKLVGEGYSDIEIKVNAKELPRLAYFGMEIETEADAYYQGSPVEDNYIPNLSSYTQTIYIANLDGKPFEFKLVGESVSKVDTEYKISSEETGTVSVKVTLPSGEKVDEEDADAADDEDADTKADDEKTEESDETEEAEEEADEIEKILEATSNAINGSGYENLELAMEYIPDFEDEKAIDSFSYNLFIDSEASEIKVNGKDNSSEGILIDDKASKISIEGLDNEKFTIRVKAIEDENVETPCKVTYEVGSKDNGIANVKFEYTDRIAANKRVYVYEDSKVYVTATLEVVDAVPDDAEFKVTEITPSTDGYNYDAYMQALNNNADAIVEDAAEEEFTSDNTVLYDIAFYVTDEDGNVTEFQPKEGSVTVSIQFKNNQLKEDLEASKDEDVTFIHLPLADAVKDSVDTTKDATNITADDIKIDVVEQSTSVDSEETEIKLDDFSVVAGHTNGKKDVKPGAEVTFMDALGQAVRYGIVANEVTLGGHLESNIATGSLHGNADVQSLKNEGGSAGVTYIGAYDGSNFKLTHNGNSGTLKIITTEAAMRNFGFNMTHLQKGSSLSELQPPQNVVIDYKSYSAKQIQDYVSGIISEVAANGKMLKDEGDKNGYDYSNIKDPYQNLIDIASIGTADEGTYYVNFKENEFPGGNFEIKLKKGQNIVLNIPDKSVEFKQYSVTIDGKRYTTQGNSDEDLLCQKVIFNCYNATKAATSQPTAGTFLVPKATFTNGSVAAGWVVANVIDKIGGQEWHCIWHDMPSVDGTSASFGVRKVFENAPEKWPESFTFNLSAVTSGAPMPSNKSVTVSDSSVKSFGEIALTPAAKEGTTSYIYKVSETKGTDENITYDATVYYVKIDVKTSKDSSGNRSATAAVYYSTDNKTWKDYNSATGITFTNSYVNKGSLTINKRVVGDVPAETFYVTVMNKDTKQYVKNGSSNVWSVKSNKSITINDLEYGTYVVTETDSKGNAVVTGSAFAYVADKTTQNVTLSKSSSDPSVTITNTVVTTPTKVNFTASKMVGSSKPTANEKFTFELKDLQSGSNIRVANGKESVTNDGSAVTFSDISYKVEDGEGTNGKTFYYLISETGIASSTPDKTLYSTDSTSYVAKVVVKNSGFTQKATVTYYKGRSASDATSANAVTTPSFVNKKFSPDSIHFYAKKTIDKAPVTGDEVFYFTLEKWDADSASWKLVSDAYTNKKETIDFGEIALSRTDSGDLFYRIGESVTKNTSSYYKYDIAKYIIKVPVKIDENLNQTVGAYSYYKTNDSTNTKPATIVSAYGTEEVTSGDVVFDNDINVEDNEVQFFASKTVDDGVPAEGEVFTFSCTEEDKTGKTFNETVDNDKTGAVTFSKIKYSKADAGKTFVYKITEKGVSTKASIAHPEFYSYDKTAYYAVVKVEQQGNKLVATTTYHSGSADGSTVKSVVFKNNNLVKPGELVLQATKSVDDGIPGAGEVFEFKLDKWNGSSWVNVSKANNTSGNITFETIKYDKEDVDKTYFYRISESGVKTKPDNTSYSYDQNKYIVKVTVGVDKDYKVTPTKEIYIGSKNTVIDGDKITDKGASVNTIEFKNTVQVTPSYAEFTAKKTVDGATPKNTNSAREIFDFKLEVLDGNTWKTVETKQNSGEDVKFSRIDYTKDDGGKTFYYRISEAGVNKNATNPDAYSIDSTTQYIAKVDVVNTGSSQAAVVTYLKGSDKNAVATVVEPTFDNHKFEGTYVDIEASKTVDDKTPAAGEVFTFTLEKKDAKGNWVKVEDATNSAGSIKFNRITYGLGDDGVYEYRVTESGKNDDTNEQYTIDGSKYIVKVTVETDANNKQSCTKSITKDDKAVNSITFKNHKNVGSLKVKKLVYVNDKLDTTTSAKFTFKVKNSAGKYINNGQVYSVNANDEVIINNLWNDTYTVEEVGQDSSFKVSYEGNNVAVNLNSNPTVTIINKKYVGAVEIAKLDATKATTFANSTKLSATFALFDANNDPVYLSGSGNEFSCVSALDAKASNGEIPNTFTTPADGSVSIKNLPEGNYILSEIATPNGYISLTNSIAFSVSAKGISTTSDVVKEGNGTFLLKMGVKNARKSFALNIHKYEVNEKDEPTTTKVAGAKFTLVGVDNKTEVYNKTFEVSSDDGMVTFDNLPWGTYTLTESTVPAGYVEVSVAGEAPKTFVIGDGTVSPDGVSTVAGLVNISNDSKAIVLDGNVYNKKQTGNLLLFKYGKNGMNGTKKALDGVNFKLVDVNGTVVPVTKVSGKKTVGSVSVSSYYKYTTDAKAAKQDVLVTADGGYIYVEGLPVVPSNSYAFVEQSPYATAFGYQAPSTTTNGVTVVVGDTKKIEVENNTIEVGIDFVKVDALKNSKTLESTTFDLYYLNGNTYEATGKSSTSAAGGKITFSGLSAGSYYAKEISTKPGYIASGDVVCFTIPENYDPSVATPLYRGTLGANGAVTVGEELKKNADGKYIFENNQGTGEASLHKIKRTSAGDAPFAGITFVLKKDSSSFVDKVFNKGYADAKVSKVSDGVYKYDESSSSTALVTDAKGNIFVDNLPWGNYYFEEVATDVNAGYSIPDASWCKDNLKFVIDEKHKSASITGDVVNELNQGYVELKKYEMVNGKIGDLITYTEKGFTFTFDLYTADGKLVMSDLHTDAGVITKDKIGPLDFGSYYFVETACGEGYKCMSEAECKSKLAFTINDTDKVVEVKATDERDRNGKLTIEKTGKFGDAAPTSDTVDVTFALYSKKNNNVSFTSKVAALVSKLFNKTGYYPYKEVTFKLTRSASDALTYTGSAVIDNLPWDEYYLVEVEAPDGLIISDEQKHFVIGAGANHLEYSFNVENNTAPGGAVIEKYDFEEEKIIKDGVATFDVYQKGVSTPIRTGITTVQGVAKVSNLQPGEYYFKEVEAPTGYLLDSSIQYNFTIKEGDKNVVVKANKAVTGVVNGQSKSLLKENIAYNKENPCEVIVRKYVGSAIGGNELGLVTFDLEKQSGLSWDVVATAVTEKSGTDKGAAKFNNLGWGTYRLVEHIPDGMSAPEGYVWNKSSNTATSPSFVLGAKAEREDKFLYEEKVVNVPKGAKVVLKKVNEKNKALAGATFTLYDESGAVVVKDIVSTDSVWTSPILEQGKYYFVENKAPEEPEAYSIIRPTNYDVKDSASFKKPESAKDGYLVEEVLNSVNSKVEYRFWFAIAASDLNAATDGDTLDIGGDKALVVKNARLTGAFGFKKVDTNIYRENTAAGLKGAEFNLIDSKGNAVHVKSTEAGKYVYDSDEKATAVTIITNDTGYAHVEGIPTGEYTLKETKAPINAATGKAYPLAAKAEWKVTITENGDDDALVKNPIKNGDNFTSFTFYKADTDNEWVDGAVFRLYKNDGNGVYVYENVKQASSASTGAVTFDNLFAGEYCVKEVAEDQADDFAYEVFSEGKAKPYYFKVEFDANDAPKPITLCTDESFKSPVAGNVVINIPRKASLKLKKVSLEDKSKYLKGAKFELIRDDGVTTSKVIDSLDGVVFEDLEVGHSYKLYETAAPEGYRLPSEIADTAEREAIMNRIVKSSLCSDGVTAQIGDSNNDGVKDCVVYTFNVSKANVTKQVAVTAPNAPSEGSISVQKVDKDNNEIKLDGAKFILYSNGEPKSAEKTTENGICEFTKLAWGTYDVIETCAPEGYPQAIKLYPEYKDSNGKVVGYKVATAKIGIEASNGEKLTWNFSGSDAIKNELVGSIELIKKDALDDSVLAGVTFKLYKDGDNSFAPKSAKTNSLGKVSFTKLPFGNYYLDEIVLDGYEYDADYTAKRNAELGDTNHYKRYPENGFITISDAKPQSLEKENVVLNERAKGRAIGYKINQYGEKIENNPATFVLYSTTAGSGWELVKGLISGESGCYKLGEVKSDATGCIKIGYPDGEYFKEGLPFGHYILVETKAPEGCKEVGSKNDIRVTFDIDKAKPDAEVQLGNIVNEEESIKIALKKVNEKGKVLKGSRFALYDANGDVLLQSQSLDSDNAAAEFTGDPVHDIKLRYGHRYYFVETGAPEGYKRGGDITADDAMGFENAVAKDTYEPVKWPLDDGSYEYRYYFVPQIGAAGKTAQITCENQPGYAMVRIQKDFDGETPDDVTGIKFCLTNQTTGEAFYAYTENEQLVDEKGNPVLNSNGDAVYGAYATWNDVPFGEYLLTEVEVPEGVSYSVSTIAKPITINEEHASLLDGKFVINDDFVNSEDNQIKAKARIYKVSSMTDLKSGKNMVVNGMKFDVYRKLANGDEKKVTEVQTDASGCATTCILNKGNYFLVEADGEAEKFGFVPETSKRYYFTINASNGDASGDKIVPVGKTCKESADGTWTISDVISEKSPIVNEPAKGRAILYKFNSAVNDQVAVSDYENSVTSELDGAVFDLYKDGVLFLSNLVVTNGVIKVGYSEEDGGMYATEGLAWGNYYFVETAAPEGFKIENDASGNAKHYEFTVGPNAYPSIHTRIEEPNAYKFEAKVAAYNAPVMKISKKDLETNTELKGAQLVLSRRNSELNATAGYSIVTDPWESGVVKEFVVGNGLSDIKPGCTYKLEEKNAPEGYSIASPIEFTVGTDGKITYLGGYEDTDKDDRTVTMVDAKNLLIEKLVFGTDTYLAGATLEIYKGDTRIGDPIETGKSAYQVMANLKVGEIYTLKETKVPLGYLKADDIYFIVNDNGTVSIVDETGAVIPKSDNISDDSKTVRMYDKPFDVVINKVRGNGSTFNIAGATLAIWDCANKMIVKQGIVTTDKPILIKTGARESYPIAEAEGWERDYQVIYSVAVEQSKAYYVLEQSAPSGFITPKASEGLPYAKVGEFVIKEDSGNTRIECSARNDDFKLIIAKKYENEILNDAVLSVVDQNFDPISGLENLKVTDSKAFLITGLSQKEYTEAYGTEDASKYNMIYGIALDENATYYLIETKAPDGFSEYASGSSIGTKNGKNVYGTKISFKSVDATSAIVTAELNDKPLEVILGKINGNGTQIAGAHMELYDATTKTVVWPGTEGGYVTKNLPVLFTVRKLSETEMKNYDMVIGDDAGEPKLVQGHTYHWRELYENAKGEPEYALPGYVGPRDYYGLGSEKPYIQEEFVLDGSYIKENRKEVQVVNKKPGFLEIKGKKDWGEAPIEERCPISIQLLRCHVGEDVRDSEIYKTAKLNTTECDFHFENLERYDYNEKGDAIEFAYYLREDINDPQYAGGFNLELEKILPNGEKELIEGELLEDGTIAWPVVFDGKSTVCEFLMHNYSALLINIPVKKTWVLCRDAEGNIDYNKKYNTITIELWQNDEKCVGSFEIENGGLKNKKNPGCINYVFEDLPKYDEKGRLYTYTIRELGNDDCVTTISEKDYQFEIENRPYDDPFTILGEKLWNDPLGKVRPNVEIILMRDGKEYKRTSLVNDKFNFGPMYEYNMGFGATDSRVNDATDNKTTADGHKYLYELVEVDAVTQKPIEDYELSVSFNGEIKVLDGTETYELPDGTVLGAGDHVSMATLTNTIRQEYINLSGIKTWNDMGDATKRPSVTFKLYATDSTRSHELVDEYVLNNSRTSYEFKNLPKYDDKYQEIHYVVEEEPLEGYATETKETDHGVDFINTPTKVVISKQDATNEAELPGAKLKITDLETQKDVEEWTSKSEPHYIEGLKIGGKYRLTEVEAPYGYNLAAPVDFTVGKAGVEQKVVMKDDPIFGSVRLTKRDKDTREILAGAIFNLYNEDGVQINCIGGAGTYEYFAGSGITALEVSATGTLVVNNLPYGTYYFQEVKAPAGYAVNGEKQSFSITKSDEMVEVTVLDEKRTGKVTLTKTNEEGTTALEGAKFELYSKTPRTAAQAVASTIYKDVYYLYGTYTTDSSGKISVDGLPWDDYYFIEIEAPKGYVISRDVNGDPLVYTFSVNDTTAKDVVIDMGTIKNSPEPTPEPEVTPTPTPHEVAGVRTIPSAGVLGVRSAPTKGVLGERVGPATGDTANIFLWILLLTASIAVLVALIVTSKKKKKNE